MNVMLIGVFVPFVGTILGSFLVFFMKKNLNLKIEKMPRKKKTWIFILALGLPLLILGLALALVFGLNTDKQLDISLQGSGSFIVQNGQGEELEGENGKYVLPSGTEVSVLVSPDVGQEIESIFVNGEKLETTAEFLLLFLYY